MKKQYLIGLLGVAAISLPVGTNLISTTSSQTTSVCDDATTLNSSFNNKETYAKNNGQYNVEEVVMNGDTEKGFSAAIVDDGKEDHLYTWGANDEGQLGFGTKDNKDHGTPQEVEQFAGKEIEEIAVGDNHSAVVIEEKDGDHLYTWGANDKGQLGYDTNEKPQNTPREVEIGAHQDIEEISLGKDQSAAIVNNELYTWGANESGQLGNGNTVSTSTPTKIGIQVSEEEKLLKDQEIEIEDVSMGEDHSAAIIEVENDITEKNLLYTWGANDQGQLGYDTSEKKQLTPKEVTELPEGDIDDISMGGSHSAAIFEKQDKDELYTWGANDKGQLGNGKIDDKKHFVPTKVELTNNDNNFIEIEDISMGGDHSAAVIEYNNSNDEDLYTWGDNSKGQLGYDTRIESNEEYPDISTPKEVTTLPDGEIEDISMGGTHSGAIVEVRNDDDELYTWGNNNYGQLGLGNDINDDHYDKIQEAKFDISSTNSSLGWGATFGIIVVVLSIVGIVAVGGYFLYKKYETKKV